MNVTAEYWRVGELVRVRNKYLKILGVDHDLTTPTTLTFDYPISRGPPWWKNLWRRLICWLRWMVMNDQCKEW